MAAYAENRLVIRGSAQREVPLQECGRRSFAAFTPGRRFT